MAVAHLEVLRLLLGLILMLELGLMVGSIRMARERRGGWLIAPVGSAVLTVLTALVVDQVGVILFVAGGALLAEPLVREVPHRRAVRSGLSVLGLVLLAASLITMVPAR